LAHLKRLGEFLNRGFAGGQTSEDGAPGGIGERGEGGIEAIG